MFEKTTKTNCFERRPRGAKIRLNQAQGAKIKPRELESSPGSQNQAQGAKIKASKQVSLGFRV
jgi:hypothetical protein